MVPYPRLSGLEDQPDSRILEHAVESGASARKTGDGDLPALGSHEGIVLMTVAGLLYSFAE